MDSTSLYSISEIEDALVKRTLREVYSSLKERGYNPTSQIVGYLVTGDPGYITNYNEARDKLVKLERAKVIETIVKDYIENNI